MSFTCPDCGKKVDENSKKCPYCGFLIAGFLAWKEKNKPEEIQIEQPKAYKVFNIIQMILSFILIIIVLFFAITCYTTNGDPFRDGYGIITGFVIMAIIILTIDIIVCGIIKGCKKNKGENKND